MIRIFKVVIPIKNEILASAEEDELLYLKGTGLYNSYNLRVCDADSECVEEIKIDTER